jgi:predicted transcriptional regulator
MTTITLKLPEHLMEQTVQFAEERDTAVNAFLESTLADYLEELQGYCRCQRTIAPV